MNELTERQIQILKAVITEYMETAEPVGSEILDKKYNLGVSPATIRNEMVYLANNGFLKQPHTSAGRSPTPKALKMYVREMMKEKDLTVAEEVAVKGKIWDHREKIERLLHESTRVLSEKTQALSVATTNNGDLYHAGFANILSQPEFFDIDVAKTVLSFIDNFELVNRIFSQVHEEEPIHILIGTELGIEYLDPCGLIFTDFHTPKIDGYIGVVGSCRLDYSSIIPTLRYVSSLIEEIGKTW